MLDTRGKKKPTMWDKYHKSGNGQHRSPRGATRHFCQVGESLTLMGRRFQRKVYANEALMKRAILSMLPKRMRNMEMEVSPYNITWGETDGYRLTFHEGVDEIGMVHVTKSSIGFHLKYPEDTIRTVTLELRKGFEEAMELKEVRDELCEAKIFRTGMVNNNGRIYPPMALEKCLNDLSYNANGE